MPLTVEGMQRQFIQNLFSIYSSADESENITAWVFEEVLNCSRTDLIIKKKKLLKATETKRLDAILKRLCKQEPVQYVLGHSYFYGLKLKVNKKVLIPRPETEELVDWIIEENKSNINSSLKILDIGTGSGCIAIALKKNLPQANVSATDISPAALKVAKSNAQINKVKIHFIQRDFLNPKTGNRKLKIDLMVSNPPYIPFSQKKNMTKNVIDYEPHQALFVRNENPLVFYDAIADFALNHLQKNGKLYFEINESFGKKVTQLLNKKGFSVTLRKDLSGKDRMVRCER